MLLPKAGVSTLSSGLGSSAWLCRAIRVVAVAAVCAPMLAGCGGSGFQPLYGSSGVGANVSEKLAQVDVIQIPGRVGQQLRNELIFQATGGGAALPPTMRLQIAIRESVTSTLVKADGNAQGQVYGLEASFKLIRIADNSVVLSGTSFARAGFERFTSVFSNVRAREDAEDRAARTVGEDLKGRLGAFLSSQA